MKAIHLTSEEVDLVLEAMRYWMRDAEPIEEDIPGVCALVDELAAISELDQSTEVTLT